MPCSATALAMLRILAPVQDAAVDFGMQGLDPAVQHLREAGEFGDIFDVNAGVAQQLGGAAGGDQFDSQGGKFAGEFHQPGFVGDAQDGALDFLGHR